MTLFTLIDGQTVHIEPNKKILSQGECTKLLELEELTQEVKRQESALRLRVAKECETLKEKAEEAGFDKGLERWSEQIGFLEKELRKVRGEMEKSIVPLAMTAAKKILGREVQLDSSVVIDIVRSALRGVAHHKRITIFVHKNDLERIEASKEELKKLFEYLEHFAIAARDDVTEHGCIIETEAGIIDARLERQWAALERALDMVAKEEKHS